MANQTRIKIEKFRRYRDETERDLQTYQLSLKGNWTDWQLSLAPVCFAIGGIAITIASDPRIRSAVLYPGYFWGGALLLIFNGGLIYWLTKRDLEKGYASLPKLAELSADLWTGIKIEEAKLAGDDSRSEELKEVEKRITFDYETVTKSKTLWQWVRFVLKSLELDLNFLLVLFPVLFLSSQLLAVFHSISLLDYHLMLLGVGVAYSVYLVISLITAIKTDNRHKTARQRIRKEIMGGS